ncbi:hypothetical protein [Pyxidicoccus trucidator]|uniref:hypothetical protein n=1 Tax=Pyxidicoccus trucidator TaxID=2709662 RepID=UPI001F076D6A|nr:hypothetical protein [Pyxidicoccus trucidator]
MTKPPWRGTKPPYHLTVLVAGLGYFVDLFDITLFGVVRAASLRDIGITSPEEVLSKGILIYNCQMVGMMVGGLPHENTAGGFPAE